MSIVSKETIEVIAQSIGITNLSTDAALMLAPDVEYRVRDIMQEAIKCMRHSKRTTLTADDVNEAFILRNVEPMYGFASGGPLRFRRALGHRNLFYVDDKEVDFKDVIEAPLPKAPLDTEIVCHWMAIEGVQPAIPENAPLEVIRAPADNKIQQQKEGPPVDVMLPVKHVLSRELQLYFQKIVELTISKSNPTLFKEALASLASDSGLHPLVPYFTNFIADEVSRGLNDYLLLYNLMHIVRSLLQNPHIHIEPYLHQLMPSAVTCLVSRKLGYRFADNHWKLRDFAANLVALICKRYGHVYSTLQPRLTKTLVNALLDPKKALTQHYGAIKGLTALGHNVVRLLILPNLEPYLKLLEPELVAEKQKNQMKRHEAWRVYGALLHAAGLCVHDRLKIFPPLPSPPTGFLHKGKGKIIGTEPYRCKVSTDSAEHQPDETALSPMQVEKPMGAHDEPHNSSQPSSTSEQANESDSINGEDRERDRCKVSTDSAEHQPDETALSPMQVEKPMGAHDEPHNSDRCKVSTDSAEHQPDKTNLSPMQVEKPMGAHDEPQNSGQPSSTSEQASESDSINGEDRERGRIITIKAIHDQIWKDDLNSGRLLVTLSDLFGERILPFIPSGEMSVFI